MPSTISVAVALPSRYTTSMICRSRRLNRLPAKSLLIIFIIRAPPFSERIFHNMVNIYHYGSGASIKKW
jgi:hypothetical protein